MIPDPFSQHVEVFLGKILNTKLPPKAQSSVCEWWPIRWYSLPPVYEFVCEWVNMTRVVKRFEISGRLEMHNINASPSPFTFRSAILLSLVLNSRSM